MVFANICQLSCAVHGGGAFPYAYSPLGILFADTSTGYVLEETSYIDVAGFDAFFRLFRTNDGGNTWMEVREDNSVFPDESISCPDSKSIFWFQGNTIYTSVDGGQTWGEWTLEDNIIEYASMFTPSEGIITTGLWTYLTTDSANTLGEQRTDEIYNHDFPDAQTRFCADWSDSLHWYYAITFSHNYRGTALPLLITTDAGQDWTNIYPDTVSRNLRYKQVSCLRGTPYAAVLTGDSINSVYCTNDWERRGILRVRDIPN
jgi:hypothetical protein